MSDDTKVSARRKNRPRVVPPKDAKRGRTPAYRPIPDEVLIRMFDDGTMTYSVSGGLLKRHPLKRAMQTVVERPHRTDGRKSYNLRIGGRQHTVYKSRLVYLWANRTPIPAGCQVDHEDQDRFNDAPDNLRVRDEIENKRDNVAAGMRECSKYFLLAKLGYDPDVAYPPKDAS